MKYIFKNKKGITLIALIITIIILLILAMVSINLVINGGILNKVKTATNEYKISEEKDKISLAYQNYQIAKVQGKENLDLTIDGAKVSGNEENWTITFEDTQNTYTLKENKIERQEKAELTDIYVTLYKDGTLAFSNNEETIEGKEVEKSYGNIKGLDANMPPQIPWWGKGLTVIFVNKIVPINTKYWFYGCTNLLNIENIENLNTSNVTNMSCMFFACKGLTSLDLSNFNTINVTNMSNMFQCCDGLTKLDLSNFNTNNVVNMSSMFNLCSKLTELDLSNFNTSNVENMNMMFCQCNDLKIIYGKRGMWKTDKVTDNASMFTGCGTDHITFKTYLQNNKIVGYEIIKGSNWYSKEDVVNSDGYNGARARCDDIIQLNPEKTYSIQLNNSNYVYGYIILDLDMNNLGGIDYTSQTSTITGVKNIVFNFKQKDEQTITDEMLNEIIEKFEIKLVE